MMENTNKNQWKHLPLVCVQGLGFVGSAMAVAVANALDPDGLPYFNVVGIDLPEPEGRKRVAAVNGGQLYFKSLDEKLDQAFTTAWRRGNLHASTDPTVYQDADIVIVDVQLDIQNITTQPHVDFTGFKKAIETLGMHMKSGSLIIVETTVPPGTCEKIVAPSIDRCLRHRGLDPGAILIAHSYERVMPGKDYYDSIINFWRVYSGCNVQAADACEQFLSKVIDIDRYPMTRLKSTTASETAKVLENSYRAANIAFIEEWGRFAESVGIDLFEVIDAIRVRPTHNNIRQPGFGVGGYCLTKDPLFAPIAAETLFNLDGMSFDFSKAAVRINNRMPLVTLDYIRKMVGGSLENRKILLLGVSYRPDVGDTRHSPSEIFYRHAREAGAIVNCHDPLVDYWPELDISVDKALPFPPVFDILVFAVGHQMYMDIDFKTWLENATPGIFDANRVLSEKQITFLKQNGYRFGSIGRGDNR